MPVVNGNGYSVTNALDWVESDAGYKTVLESSRVLFGYVDTSEDVPFTGVMVQHYAWLQRVVHVDKGIGTKLTLINTAGKVLPTNDMIDPSTIPMFVNPDGTIYKQMKLPFERQRQALICSVALRTCLRRFGRWKRPWSLGRSRKSGLMRACFGF